MPDDFYANLCATLTSTLHDATRQLDELRRENTRLRKLVAELPSTATDLQDRVTLLERRAVGG